MDLLFWISLGLIAYVYAGYPLLLGVCARLADRRPRKALPAEAAAWPSISIIVAARNEAGRLGARVDNLLRIPYAGRREIIVVSDGSTDDPASALQRFGAAVTLLEQPAAGKPSALNAGVEAAHGDILIFADARQYFSDSALIDLVANFADPQVGGVTGELVLDAERGTADSTVGDGVGLYWKYEKWLRRQESLLWSTVGATGAIYALRRPLWRALPHDTLLDDVLAPMGAVLGGWRVVFEERAIAFDRASTDADAEARRKVRTLAGNYQILKLEPRLLVPFVNPVWFQYLSHKLGRLLVPWALLAAFVSSAYLATGHWGYGVALGLQVAFYGLAAYGAWSERRARNGMNFAATARQEAR